MSQAQRLPRGRQGCRNCRLLVPPHWGNPTGATPPPAQGCKGWLRSAGPPHPAASATSMALSGSCTSQALGSTHTPRAPTSKACRPCASAGLCQCCHCLHVQHGGLAHRHSGAHARAQPHAARTHQHSWAQARAQPYAACSHQHSIGTCTHIAARSTHPPAPAPLSACTRAAARSTHPPALMGACMQSALVSTQ